MTLLVKKLNEKATIPQRQTKFSAGYDLSSAEDIVVKAGETAKIHTGISFRRTQQPIRRQKQFLKEPVFLRAGCVFR